MGTRVASYNVEWFDDHFNADNSMKLTAKHKEKHQAVKKVFELLNADLISLVEAPNTSVTTGHQSTIAKLENFAHWAGLRTSKAAMGFVSGGRQEIALLYDPLKMTISHAPGGSASSRSNPKFNGEFYFDTDDDHIKEVYKHYRPPFEAKVQMHTGEVFYTISVHTKSKGVFASMDQVHLEHTSRRNRLKLFAECAWIRKRVDEWLSEGRQFLVMGDMNDGPGMDLYELRYGRSAVEIIMGDLFEPNRILHNYLGRPKWTNKGWSPASARFKDRVTETYVQVWIDHILASPNLPVMGSSPLKIWNPYEEDSLKEHKQSFKLASDHFPLTIEIDL